MNSFYNFRSLIRLPDPLFQIHKRMLLRLPNNAEELLCKPKNSVVTFTAEADTTSVDAFRIISRHFPKAWGFLWSLDENSLSTTLLDLPWKERENIYRQLARRNCSQLRSKVSQVESSGVLDGLLTVGGESGKRIISETFKCVGLPAAHIAFKCDLAFLDLKNKVPLGWLAREFPVAYNIHPAPPEKPGAGVYVPSLLAGEEQYGVTVHFLTPRVDDGPIIAVRRFRIPEKSTLTSLRALTTQHCLEMLEDLLLRMKFTEPLSEVSTICHYRWGGNEFTRKMIRKMIKETKRKFGEKGHPALL